MNARRFCISFALAAASCAVTFAAEDIYTGVDRVVAIGDIHGDYDQLLTVLRNAGVIDRKGTKWTGGKTHLVQTGDILDRAGGSRKCMDFLMDLEKQARKARGAVHVLIGNHEAMNVYGDLRYTVAEEFASYAAPNSTEIREAFWKEQVQQLKPNTPDQAYRQKWEAEHPLGFFEHRYQFSPKGTYGEWIRGLNAAIQINDTLFLHGGISPKYAGSSIRQINDTIRGELADFSKLEGGMVPDDDGPLWYRGLAQGDENQLSTQVQAVLNNYHVRRIVVGHTVTPGAIIPRFGGTVLTIDVGMSRFFGGPPVSLLMEQGKVYAIHRGVKIEIPSDPGSRTSYLMECAKLEPAGSKLQQFAVEQGR
jgi:hypothetical protein